MSHEQLIRENARIKLKISKLPSAARRRIESRVAYLIDKNKLDPTVVSLEIIKLRDEINSSRE